MPQGIKASDGKSVIEWNMESEFFRVYKKLSGL